MNLTKKSPLDKIFLDIIKRIKFKSSIEDKEYKNFKDKIQEFYLISK